MLKILEKLKEVRKKHIKEKNGESFSGNGRKKADLRGYWHGVETGKPLLGFDDAIQESFDAWKHTMDEEAIPSYQPPEVSTDVRSVLAKLD